MPRPKASSKSTTDSRPPKLPRSQGWRLTHAEEELLGCFLAYHLTAAQVQVDSARSAIEVARTHGDPRMLAYGESSLVWARHCVALLERLLAAVSQNQQYPRPEV